MPHTPLTEARADGGLIRNEPVQARSTARLAALLDAAAEVIDEIGYERLTTAMVADRAGASIGTVYRYFPDRIAVLQNLAARNAERITDRVLDAIRSEQHADWTVALRAAFDVYVDAFRSEPGFSSLRLGDVLDLRPASGTPANTVLADRMYDALVARFGFESSERGRTAFEAGVESSDALIARAFARDPEGSPEFLEMGRTAATALMLEYFGTPSSLSS